MPNARCNSPAPAMSANPPSAAYASCPVQTARHRLGNSSRFMFNSYFCPQNGQYFAGIWNLYHVFDRCGIPCPFFRFFLYTPQMLTRSVPSGPMFVSICNIGTSFFALSLALYSSIQLHIRLVFCIVHYNLFSHSPRQHANNSNMGNTNITIAQCGAKLFSSSVRMSQKFEIFFIAIMF